MILRNWAFDRWTEVRAQVQAQPGSTAVLLGIGSLLTVLAVASRCG